MLCLLFTSVVFVVYVLQHLQSDQHRSFALDISNYIAVDQLVAEMVPEFNPDPCQQSEDDLNR